MQPEYRLKQCTPGEKILVNLVLMNWMGYATIYISQLQNYFNDKDKSEEEINARRNKNHPKKRRATPHQ